MMENTNDNNRSVLIVEEDEASFEACWDNFLEASGMAQFPPEQQEAAQRVFYAGAAAFLQIIDAVKPQAPGVSAMLASVQQLSMIQQEIISFFEQDVEDSVTLTTKEGDND